MDKKFTPNAGIAPSSDMATTGVNSVIFALTAIVILRLYGEVMKEISNDGKVATQSQVTKIEEEIMAHEARLASATNKFLDDEISATLYEELKQRIELEKKACLSKLDMLKTPKGADLEPQFDYAISLINNMESHIREGALEAKRELIGVMFPEKFDFDGETYRTNSYNKVLDLIYLQTNELRGQKKKRLFRFL